MWKNLLKKTGKEEHKKEIFAHILNLYNNITGSSLTESYFGLYSSYYMWRNSDSDTNIISNKKPENRQDNTLDNEFIILGIYYIDQNGNISIKFNETGGYKFIDYDSIANVISCDFANGSHNFTLDTSFKDGILENIDIIKQIEVVLNRLPKTFRKSTTAAKTLYSDSKVIMRINNLTNPVSSNQQTGSSGSLINDNTLQQNIIRANKIAARSAYDVKSINTATINQIEPKIQAAYGFSDLGKIKNLNKYNGDVDDGSYVTTHKIGYEDVDRYRLGEKTCDSYLFLSPLTHSEIQVNGDSNKSNISINADESLRVPIIYQYRMEDYNGNIFGNSTYKSSDAIVKTAKFANIIGIDIWLNTLSDTPKQYDIVVYSTYNKDNSRTSGTITKKIN